MSFNDVTTQKPYQSFSNTTAPRTSVVSNEDVVKQIGDSLHKLEVRLYHGI